MRIAVDAMGSDAHPAPDVAGGVQAARETGVTVLLVGDEARIQTELQQHDTGGAAIEVIHAPQAITMADKPTEAGKNKPNSSMHIAMGLVRDGGADAFVTMGNTGAALTIAVLHQLKRGRGVKRPALGQIIQAGSSRTVLIDIGATPDARPEWLFQFAVMGVALAQTVLKEPAPTVALLSNGEEEGKGNQAVREASELLRQSSLNFVGNIEPKDILTGGAHVAVSDGFVGNIMIKSAEGALSHLGTLLRREVRRSPVSLLGGLLLRPALRRVQRELDPYEIGGALLLGVNGVVVIGHGRSDARAVKNAIGQARAAVEGGIVAAVEAGLEQASVPRP